MNFWKRVAVFFWSIGARKPAGITDEDGATVFRHACKLGLEGIISKRLAAPYRSGPSRDWAQGEEPGQSGDAARACGAVVIGYSGKSTIRRGTRYTLRAPIALP